MVQTLAERFARDAGAPQDVDGRVVHCIYRHEVVSGQRVHVHWVRAVERPVQGLRLKLSTGTLLVGGESLEDVVLWMDTAPVDVELVCKVQPFRAELRVWNCWRDEQGVMQAWLGDAGMIVEESRNRTLLRCSAGSHAFSPIDLEVELEFDRVVETR